MSANDAMNILCKWRTVLAGWQLGTRLKGDPEGDAVRDHREGTLLLRAEVTALTSLLIAAGVFTLEQFDAQLEIESQELCKLLEKRFPGFKATPTGMDVDVELAVKTQKGWRP